MPRTTSAGHATALSGDPKSSADAAREFLALTGKPRVSSSSLFAAVISRFVLSPVFLDRSEDWQKESIKRHELIVDKFGTADIKFFERREMRQHVIDFRDKFSSSPRTADKIITELCAILNWAKDRGEVGAHVAEGVGKLFKVDRSDIIWEPSELQAMREVMKPEQSAFMMLAAYTGLDLGDLCALTWSAVGQFDIRWRRGKTGIIAMPPILDGAREVLNGLPKRSVNVLTNTRGLPWTAKGYSATFRKAKARAGVTGKRFKDLRGTACTNFLIAGMTTRETAEAMGWSQANVERMSRKYVHRDKVAEATVTRLNANKIVKTDVKT